MPPLLLLPHLPGQAGTAGVSGRRAPWLPRSLGRTATGGRPSRTGHVLHMLVDLVVAVGTALLSAINGPDLSQARVPPAAACVAWGAILVASCLALAARYRFPAQVVAVLASTMTVHALVFPQVSATLVLPVVLVAAETTQSRLLAPWRWVATAWLFGGTAVVAWNVNLLVASTNPYPPGPLLRGVMVLEWFMLLTVVSLWGARRRAAREQVDRAVERAAMLEAQQEIQARLAVAEERQHIAREVHDLLGHSLSVIAVQAAGAQAVLGADSQAVSRALDVIGATSRRCVDEVHALVDTLREEPGKNKNEEPGADPQGPALATAVEAPGRTTAAPHGTDLQKRGSEDTHGTLRGQHTGTAVPGDPARDPSRLEDLASLAAQYRTVGSPVRLVLDLDALVPDDVSRVLYRTAREALTNAARHAPGAAVRVRAVASGGRAQLTVTNDAAAAGVRGGPTHGLGLRAARERVEALGGTCEAGPEESGGWRLHVVIPLLATVPAQASAAARTRPGPQRSPLSAASPVLSPSPSPTPGDAL